MSDPTSGDSTLSADTIRSAIQRIKDDNYRAPCPHLIGPLIEVVWRVEDLDGTEWQQPCAAMCGAVLVVRRKKLTVEDLKRAVDELAYSHSPVEARLTADAYSRFRVWLLPDPTKPIPRPSPMSLYSGIKVIVDPTIAPNRIEFRDADGNVTAAFEIS